MSRFEKYWAAHVGQNYVCDRDTFDNQCAMRMGSALRSCGVIISGLKTCIDYNPSRFKDHEPGHIREAQALANYFYRNPTRGGLGASEFKVFEGSISGNLDKLKNVSGMIFIMNGWGTTDHIDLWKGNPASGTLRGGTSSYLAVGQQVWFWAIS
ncbi:T6SS effector amidase Tae4 family protein [Jiella pelagia]|uniref:T6SS effector amidase Tae4 family protein n=1 Tax=Jiella pelagia TaxID=2986949 RepID=A0ABY7C0C0_9HYPH|nr:T6SS effector amidase Tae4 family protein [Jiella pelagia]WAP68661.1 T6SS effector amidase Tae4 family protein [Jiella pelagia]